MNISLRAFVVGYTGETAKSLIKVLAKDKRYASVKLIGRRQTNVDYGTDMDSAITKFSQHVIDFERLDDYQLLFTETDVGFSTLGTTIAKSGRVQMRVIEHDYLIKVAELALASGCKEFHFVSSRGANRDSYSFYLRLKGEIETDIQSSCVFPNYLAIYRPGFLLCNRSEPRLLERVFNTLMKPVYALDPHWLSVPVEILAQAMANAPFCLASIMQKKAQASGDSYDPKVLIVENAMLFDLASDEHSINPDVDSSS